MKLKIILIIIFLPLTSYAVSSQWGQTPIIFDETTGNGTNLPMIKEGGVNVQPQAVESLVIILVEFSDQQFNSNFTPDYFHRQFFSRNPDDKSIHYFYYENSYGRTQLEGDVYGPFQLSQTMSYYGNDDDRSYILIRDALQAANASVNFSQYGDDHGKIAHPIIIHAGRGQEERPSQTELIWSLRWGNNLNLGTFDGLEADWGIILAETSPVGVGAHELGHDFGLIDLYDFDDGSPTEWDFNNYPVESWCIMAKGSWGKQTTPGDTPTHFCGFNKMKLGWIDPVTIEGGQIRPVHAIQTTYRNALFKIPLATYTIDGMDVEEYFLVENRYGEGVIFDQYTTTGQPLDQGILITHVDERQIYTQRQSLWNSSTSPEIPNLPHYAVWIEDPAMISLGNNRVNSQRKLDAAYSVEDNQTIFNDLEGESQSLYYATAHTNDGEKTGVSIQVLSPATQAMEVAFFESDTTKPHLTMTILPNSAFPNQLNVVVVSDEAFNPLPDFIPQLSWTPEDAAYQIGGLQTIDNHHAIGRIQLETQVDLTLRVLVYDAARNAETRELSVQNEK